MTATRVMRGATSFSNCGHFPIIEGSRTPNPVTLPPGRARLWITPDPTGSSISTKTMGIAASACGTRPVRYPPTAAGHNAVLVDDHLRPALVEFRLNVLLR